MHANSCPWTDRHAAKRAGNSEAPDTCLVVWSKRFGGALNERKSKSTHLRGIGGYGRCDSAVEKCGHLNILRLRAEAGKRDKVIVYCG